MRFLVDNQLPAALARFLSSRGVECLHVLDVNLAESSDAEIWEYATRNNCIVVSKDEDFFYLANAPGVKTRLIWIRFGNCRTKMLLSMMENLWPRIEASLMAGEQIIEVR